LQRPDAAEPQCRGSRIEPAILSHEGRDALAVTVCLPGIPANLGAGRMKVPKATGPVPTGIVAITAFVAPTITDTLLDPKFAT
jgi:hypothetical protein